MFDWIKKVLRSKPPGVDPYNRFVIEFVEECNQQGRVPKSYDYQARAFTFSDGAGERIFHLNNVFGAWLARDQTGRAEVISRFVRAIGESAENSAISPEKLPDELMPGIRARVSIRRACVH